MTATTHTPAVPASTSSRGTRALGVASLVGVVFLALMGLWFSDADELLGETVRIMYVHVPTVSTAYLMIIVSAVSSVVYLRRRTELPDLLAHATAEIGTVLLGLTLVTGALWGRPTWGTYWQWDARLTTTLLLFLVMVGYLTVRSAGGDRRQRGTRSAVIAVVAALLIPIVYKSVDWWQTLHQSRTAFGTLDPKIHGSQAFTLLLSIVVFSVLSVWLTIHRFRVAWLADRADDVGLEAAITERRGGAGAPARAGLALPLAAAATSAAVESDQWTYVIAAWAITVAVIAVYVVATLRRGRSLSALVPADQRRWM